MIRRRVHPRVTLAFSFSFSFSASKTTSASIVENRCLSKTDAKAAGDHHPRQTHARSLDWIQCFRALDQRQQQSTGKATPSPFLPLLPSFRRSCCPFRYHSTLEESKLSAHNKLICQVSVLISNITTEMIRLTAPVYILQGYFVCLLFIYYISI